jgi:hypothetical protein
LGEKILYGDTGITDLLDLEEIAISSLVLREVGRFVQDAAQGTQRELDTRQGEGIYQFVNSPIPSSQAPLESWQSSTSSTEEQSCQTPETWDDAQGIQQAQEIPYDTSNYLSVNPVLFDPSLIAWAISY